MIKNSPKKSISRVASRDGLEVTLESELADQIEALMKRVGGRSKAAEIMGVAVSTVDNYRSGTTQPKILELVRLSTAAQVPMAALFSPQRQGLVAPDFLGGQAVSIPRYDVAASMGAGRLVAATDVSEYLTVGRDWLRRNLPAWAPTNAIVGILEGSGDSMEPTVRDGDLLMVVQGVEWPVVERGGIFVFTLDDRLLLKRLQVLDNGDLKIISDNKSYEPWVIPFREIPDRLILHGQVFFTGGKPRSFA